MTVPSAFLDIPDNVEAARPSIPPTLYSASNRAPYEPTTVPFLADANVIAAWRFEANPVTDDRGLFPSFSITGNTTLDAGKSGLAYKYITQSGFTASSVVSRLSVPHVLFLPGAGKQWTIDFWLYVPDLTDINADVIVYFGDGFGTTLLQVGNHSDSLKRNIYLSETGMVAKATPFVMGVGWHHVALAYIHNASSLSIYIDGVEYQFSANCVTTDSTISQNWGFWGGSVIGAQTRVGTKIDSFRLHNVARSSAWVQQVYLQG